MGVDGVSIWMWPRLLLMLRLYQLLLELMIELFGGPSVGCEWPFVLLCPHLNAGWGFAALHLKQL